MKTILCIGCVGAIFEALTDSPLATTNWLMFAIVLGVLALAVDPPSAPQDRGKS